MSILKSLSKSNLKIINYSITIAISLLMISNCIVLYSPNVSSTLSAPDTYGYRWINSNNTSAPYVLYNWVDGVGGSNDLSLGNDQISGNIDLGFKFPFYGNSYSSIYICSNGWATFTDPGYTTKTGNPMPSTTRPNGLIAPYWTDLNPGQHGNVTYLAKSQASPKHFIISWNSVPTNLGSYQYNQTFEAIIYENGSILFQYKSINLTTALSPVIGIENSDGNHGLSYPTSSLENGTAIWFYYIYQAHDVSVKSMKMKAYASVNKDVNIKAYIQNFGYSDEVGINVTLEVNGNLVNWTGPIINLISFTGTEIEFIWRPVTQGNHSVSVKIIQLPGENKTDNNVLTKSIDVRKWRGIVLYDKTHGGGYYDYNTWFNDLNLKNIAVEEYTSGEITDEALKDYTVLMLAQASGTFEPNELTAVHNFINSGHGLMMLTGYEYSMYDTISSPYEITWYNGNSYTTGTTSDVVAHEITANVQNVYISSSRARLEATGGAKDLVYYADKSGDREPILSVSNESGAGRVACFTSPYAFDDWRISNANNRFLATQIMEWVIGDRTPPARPKGFKAINGKVGNQINLTWIPNTENDLRGYYLYRGNSSGNYETEPIFIPPEASKYYDKGEHIKDGTQYYYKLAAIDEVPNISKFTSESSATVSDIIPPITPINFTITDIGTGSDLLISWNINPELDVQEYKLYIADNFEFTGQKIIKFSPTNNSYMDTGLSEDKNYYYRLSAIDEVPNESPKTPIKVGTPYDRVAPETPTGFNATDPGLGNTAYISWYLGAEDDLRDYLVERKDKKGAIEKMYVPITPTFFNEAKGLFEFYDSQDLVDGQRYSYRVSARDDSKLLPPNLSPPTKWINVTPTDKTPPTIPENFTISDESHYIANEPIHCLNLSWNISNDVDLRGFIIYRFDFPDFKISERKLLVKLGLVDHYKDFTVEEGMEYYYKVTSYDEIPNESPPSVEIKGVPKDVTPPPIPLDFEVESLLEGGAVKVKWSLMPDTEVEGFRLYFKEQSNQTGDFQLLADFDKTENEYLHTGLINDQEYYYKLQSFDIMPNYSSFTRILSATPSDNLPPENPTGVKVEIIETGGSLKISWKPNDDSDLDGYRVYRSTGTEFLLVFAVDENTTSIIDTGLTNNIPYKYYVTAIDEVPNESERSIVKNGIPKDGVAPTTPTGLTASIPDSKDRIVLKWQNSEDSDVNSYQIYKSRDNIEFEEIAIISFTDNTFIDFGVDGGTQYYYKITASDAESNKSPKSQTVEITMSEKSGENILSNSMTIIVIVIIIVILILLVAVFVLRRHSGSEKAGKVEGEEVDKAAESDSDKDIPVKDQEVGPDPGAGVSVKVVTPIQVKPGTQTTKVSSTTTTLETTMAPTVKIEPTQPTNSTMVPSKPVATEKLTSQKTETPLLEAATIKTEPVTPEETRIEPELTTPPTITEPEMMDIEPDTSIDEEVSEQELIQPLQTPTQKPEISIVSPEKSIKPLPVILIPVDEDGDYDGQGVNKDEKGRVTILNPKIMYSPRLPLRKPPIGKVVKLKHKEK
jgi:fibronectin type 3 domain-containing protein